MKFTQLIESFLKTAKWSEYKDKENRPIRGSKWITKKQSNFMFFLWGKENPMAHLDGRTIALGDYTIKIGKKAPNGCRCLNMELRNESK